jgi:hypothetical protein
MKVQTIKNDPADRSDEAKNELEKQLRSIWQGRQDSNLRHPVLETGALPTELRPYKNAEKLIGDSIYHSVFCANCHHCYICRRAARASLTSQISSKK